MQYAKAKDSVAAPQVRSRYNAHEFAQRESRVKYIQEYAVMEDRDANPQNVLDPLK
jgi:hypothetical protein